MDSLEQIRKDQEAFAQNYPLYSLNKKIVFCRGYKKPKILFVGEAPSFTENEQGKPFVGKSGKLLNEQITNIELKPEDYAITNIVPIMPLDTEGKIRQPTEQEMLDFRPFLKRLISVLNPQFVVMLGKSAAFGCGYKCNLVHAGSFVDEAKRFYFVPHPSYLLRKEQKGFEYYKALRDALTKASDYYVKEISVQGKNENEVVDEFLKTIGAKKQSSITFEYKDEVWLIDFHPADHSDDVLVEEKIVPNYDKFLLVKHGRDRVRIVGWVSKAELMSTPLRDIYRNGKSYYCAFDTVLHNLESFRIPNKQLKLLDECAVNQETADATGRFEMVSGLLAGFHSFAKRAKIYFKDLNQKDECLIEGKRTKIYTRTIVSDEDMLIPEDFFQANKDIELFVLCKIKGGKYNFVGYVPRRIVEETRVVQMLGTEGVGASE